MCLPSVIVRLTLDMAGIILTAAGLGFLGLGAQPPLAGMGRDDLHRPRSISRPVVGRDHARPRDLHRQPRLQPARRRPARRARSAERPSGDRRRCSRSRTCASPSATPTGDRSRRCAASASRSGASGSASSAKSGSGKIDDRPRHPAPDPPAGARSTARRIALRRHRPAAACERARCAGCAASASPW